MDAFARGLKIAAAIRKDGRLAEFLEQRYASWDSGIGAKIESGKADLAALEAYMLKQGEAAPNASGRLLEAERHWHPETSGCGIATGG